MEIGLILTSMLNESSDFFFHNAKCTDISNWCVCLSVEKLAYILTHCGTQGISGFPEPHFS